MINKDQKDLIKRTIMFGASDDELEMFMGIGNRYDLDPFVKQISAQPFKDKKTGGIKWNYSIDRDGYLKIANRNVNFLGLVSSAIYSKDIFEADIGDGIIKHIIKIPRGDLVGAWAKAQSWNPNANRPNMMLIAVDTVQNHLAEIQESGNVNFWRDETEKMLIKEAEKMVLKKVVPIEEKQTQGFDKKDALPVSSHNEGVEIIQDTKEIELLEDKQTTEPAKIESKKDPEPTKTIDLPALDLPDLDLGNMEPVKTEPKKEEPVQSETKKEPETKTEEPEPAKSSKKKTSKKEIKNEPNQKINWSMYASDPEPNLYDFPVKVMQAVLEDAWKEFPQILSQVDTGYKTEVHKKTNLLSCLELYYTIAHNNITSLIASNMKTPEIDWVGRFQARMERIINMVKTDIVPKLTKEMPDETKRDLINKITDYDDFGVEWVLRFVNNP